MITDSVDTLVNMYINARNLFIAGKIYVAEMTS